MTDQTTHTQAVELLQHFGLKTYEARCFVALTRVQQATAKEISEISEVPRTRVYDAVAVLDSEGLVEVQHSNPQLFRAVSIDEAIETLRTTYESRLQSLRDAVELIEPVTLSDEPTTDHEVWALSGSTAVTNRTKQLLESADEEVFLVVGTDAVYRELIGSLREAIAHDVDVVVAAATDSSMEQLDASLSEATVIESGLSWLETPLLADRSEMSIGRLVLIDGETVLISSVDADGTDGVSDEQAVIATGGGNSLVLITRSLLARELSVAEDDPPTDPD